jgi:hypothetical protein
VVEHGSSHRVRVVHRIRIDVFTPLAFDEVLTELRGRMGTATPNDINAVAQEAISETEFARLVSERFVGSSGFMFFAEINHGDWLPKFGISRRVVRWIIGNPLLAVTMIRLDLTAGLFAPVELLITENDKSTTRITYVQPSSLMVIGGNQPLLDAAQALDEKLATLVADATNQRP